MENSIYTKTETIRMSDADYSLKLSFPDIFAACMDLASDHSDILKNSEPYISPLGLYWVVAKTKIRIHRRPEWNETVTESTWPTKPNRIRENRDYLFTKDGETLVEAVTEWAIVDRNVGRLTMIDRVYAEDFAFEERELFPEGFTRFTDDFPEEPFARYTVRSVDIDFEGHMNNVSYLRAMFGLFSRAELDAMAVKEVEIDYKSSCYEGQTLLWRKHEVDGALRLQASLEDGTVIILAELK